MVYLYLASSIAGLLLAVRLMFFGAERRRRQENALPLRRSEPAIVAFLVWFGFAGYLLATRSVSLTSGRVATIALLSAGAFSALVLRLAIATARIRPEHDPDDPRYALQGRVVVVTQAIPSEGVGTIHVDDPAHPPALPAREIAGAAIEAGEEVCIERIEGGMAWVERWSVVEARL